MELNKQISRSNLIEKVKKGSIAEELEIKPGDILVSINDKQVDDIIDYKYLVSDEYIYITIQKQNGDIWEFEIEKDFDEDLGIEFTNPLIDKAKSCKNKCIFCFIDQLPKGMRKTLYFKDDDSRLSFLQGNFITLTNMSDEDINKIIKYRLSPIKVSVHTTNGELRKKMLNNKNADKILDILKKFNDNGIKMNCQIVLVPGVNDGKELEKTLKDLSSLYPNVMSVAVVPVGVTKYRKNLYDLDIYDKKLSNELLDLIHEKQGDFLKELGTKFVFASDEFYAMTGRKRLCYDEYEGFSQLENGVGLMTLFEYEVKKALNSISEVQSLNKKYTIVTGTLAYNFVKSISQKVMKKFKNLILEVVPIDNDFFGHTITVSGLIVGQDIINQLKLHDIGDGIIMPTSMLRDGEDVFLDDITVNEVQKQLNTKVIVSEVSGKNFINIFTKYMR